MFNELLGFDPEEISELRMEDAAWRDLSSGATGNRLAEEYLGMVVPLVAYHGVRVSLTDSAGHEVAVLRIQGDQLVRVPVAATGCLW